MAADCERAAEMAGPNWRTSNEITVMTKEIERWLTEGHEEMVGVNPTWTVGLGPAATWLVARSGD